MALTNEEAATLTPLCPVYLGSVEYRVFSYNAAARKLWIDLPGMHASDLPDPETLPDALKIPNPDSETVPRRKVYLDEPSLSLTPEYDPALSVMVQP